MPKIKVQFELDMKDYNLLKECLHHCALSGNGYRALQIRKYVTLQDAKAEASFRADFDKLYFDFTGDRL